MVTIHLKRVSCAGKAVRGTITGTAHVLPTLENAQYIIPEGKYELAMTWSPRFKKIMPLVYSVPGRSGIRIHRGTKPEHSKGCVLVNAAMEQDLTAKWLALQASKEPIKITIKNEN